MRDVQLDGVQEDSMMIVISDVQVQVAKLYQDAKVNPLAGCLPTLITLPVWIGLYRALSNVADEGLLTEGFFWIPSLAGPTSLAAQKAVSASMPSDLLLAVRVPKIATLWMFSHAKSQDM